MHLFNCYDVTTRIALGDLEQASWYERFKVRVHLATCWLCRRYERQLKVIGEAFRLASREQVPAHVNALKQRLSRDLPRHL